MYVKRDDEEKLCRVFQTGCTGRRENPPVCNSREIHVCANLLRVAILSQLEAFPPTSTVTQITLLAADRNAP